MAAQTQPSVLFRNELFYCVFVWCTAVEAVEAVEAAEAAEAAET